VEECKYRTLFKSVRRKKGTNKLAPYKKIITSTKALEWARDIFVKEIAETLIIWQHTHVVP
jgi:hypothetical protein